MVAFFPLPKQWEMLPGAKPTPIQYELSWYQLSVWAAKSFKAKYLELKYEPWEVRKQFLSSSISAQMEEGVEKNNRRKAAVLREKGNVHIFTTYDPI